MRIGATSLFVYYRVRAGDAAAVIAAVREQHAALSAALPGLACSLSQRVEAGADPVTLMETYNHASGMTDAAQRAIEERLQAALKAWLIGARHVEVFVTCV